MQMAENFSRFRSLFPCIEYPAGTKCSLFETKFWNQHGCELSTYRGKVRRAYIDYISSWIGMITNKCISRSRKKIHPGMRAKYTTQIASVDKWTCLLSSKCKCQAAQIEFKYLHNLTFNPLWLCAHRTSHIAQASDLMTLNLTVQQS